MYVVHRKFKQALWEVYLQVSDLIKMPKCIAFVKSSSGQTSKKVCANLGM